MSPVSLTTPSQPSNGERDPSSRGPDLEFVWGSPADIGSTAFWVEQCNGREPEHLQLGDTLTEEVAACLLGGYGTPADVGVAAFRRLRTCGALHSGADYETLVALLSAAFDVPGRDRPIRYRFARQRAERLATAMNALAQRTPPTDPLELRSWLAAHLPGVGLKTASWIVRNRHPDAHVAVIDVHIHRAGVGAGFFDPAWSLPRDYLRFEEAFLAVCRLGGVTPSLLDHVIWSTMASVSLPTRAMLCRFALDLAPHGSPYNELV